MPNPEANTTDKVKSKSTQSENEFLDFLDNPVQEFEAPELPETELKEEKKNDLYDFEYVDEVEPKSPKESKGMASRYVKLFDKGFSNIVAAYASGEATDYQIDQSDQDDLADPLAELIAEKDILDLPPSWALVITALIIYAPLIMKAVGERKDNKAVEEKEKKKDKSEKTDTEQSGTK